MDRRKERINEYEIRMQDLSLIRDVVATVPNSHALGF